MKLYIGAYYGVSIVSRTIQLLTWGKISHVSLIRANGQTIEAWHKGGVCLRQSPWALHTPETKIRIFELAYAGEKVWNKALQEVGKGYDFTALAGFIPGFRIFHKNDLNKWFCSELASYACDLSIKDKRVKYCSLFNETIPYHKIDPAYLCSSVNLKPIGVAQDLEEFKFLINIT